MPNQIDSKKQSINNNTSNNPDKKQNTFPYDEFKKYIEIYAKEKKWDKIRDLLVRLSPATVAEIIKKLEKFERMNIFRSLPRKFAADVFSELRPRSQVVFLKDLTNIEAAELLADLSPDDRTALFEVLPEQEKKRLFELLNPEDLQEASQLLGYPENSVGRLMTPDYITIHSDWKVETALKYIREKGKDSEILSNIYIVDEQKKLIDDIRLRQIILANPSDKISDLMNYTFDSINAYDDQEKAYYLIKKSNLYALPVVDSKGTILGIVTIDDLLDVGEEEATEDFHKIAAMSELKLSDKIRDTPVRTLYRKRIGWLVFLVFVNIFSGAAIAIFEDTIAKYIVLVLFMPLLVDCGGNAGAQASTLMVRALAIKDVALRDWYYCIGKETLVAGALGITMGLAVSVIGIFRGGIIIALIVSLSMVVIVFVGSLVGISLPFIFTRVGWDPAVASGPLITSIADVAGIILYFSIAITLLGF